MIMPPQIYNTDGKLSVILKLIKYKIKRAVYKLWNDIYRCRIIIIILIVYGISTRIAFGEGCPFKILTGWECPGCGLTRGCLCVLTGRWKQVVVYNVMSFAWVALIIWLLWEHYFTEKRKIIWEPPVILVSIATIVGWLLTIIHFL